MNNQQHDFLNKIRNTTDSLALLVSNNETDTKEAIEKIKEMRSCLTHLYNILKVEESLREMKQSSR